MPYVKQDRRDAINPEMSLYSKVIVDLTEVKNAGELNYLVTQIIRSYYARHPGYQGINDVSGALTEALAEFRRRVTVDYENGKVQENGDVY